MSVKILPFVAAGLLSVIVLFMPQSGVPSSWPGTDKVVHLTLFALLAATGLYAGFDRWRLAAALVGYAAVSEVLQALLTALGRSGDVLDGLTDVVGVVVGLVVFRAISGGIRSR
ncbi:VanZ family protein [Actinosynnema sp. NPDC020468]|uniref:VanZ family protein n=1 Tax=Actinosynnema sp. NPDC020468 TaxID=3154488 RepID=UPI0033EFE43E